ncbi:hypothetical protein V6N13_108602 [Hibiscus sabdariffa]|uniref:Uncharacterized protein n=1 Tax=Hibiscus sabdariffa TaxID=183260 RepID=A0ABR2SSL6_9ROSI
MCSHGTCVLDSLEPRVCQDNDLWEVTHRHEEMLVGSREATSIEQVVQPKGGLRAGSRKVLSMPDIMLNLMSHKEQIVAEERLKKRGRGRPRKNPPKSLEITNGSLSDSDFINHKGLILRETREMVDSGKLIGLKTIRNGNIIIRDIA